MNDESPFHKFDYLESNVILVILPVSLKYLPAKLSQWSLFSLPVYPH